MLKFYDGNGNILTYSRNGTTKNGQSLAMDNLTYHYKPGTNQLNHVADQVSGAAYEEDLDHQQAGNYSYDAIGNLIKDNQEGLTSIEWTVYGKIGKIEKSNGMTITYSYDASGQRIG